MSREESPLAVQFSAAPERVPYEAPAPEPEQPADGVDSDGPPEEDVSSKPPQRQRPAGGRPRDPRVDRAIRDAATQIYAEEGWAGFQFDAIAKRAGVGKSAVYRRWATREDLVIEAIRGMDTAAVVGDAATLREALTRIAREQLEWWGDTPGAAYLRLQMDQVKLPALGDLYSTRVRGPLLDVVRGMVGKAVASGEVPPGTSTTLLVEMLSGAMMMRMGSSSRANRQKLVDNPDEYIALLVDYVLAAATAGGKRR
ncbi:TetR family transcriptional regulator [Pseudonocardia sulfidoxydans NBRC 16205]|uniref:TetR family transcriptional regulator n=2 Tax=Pseudonocardia sulfidoxydans TaxID=54011 RepID=A0A511DIF4_9PSEU|nr:TetR/AcrR family transcriptional regulator [Pseudonocardia sulfidoxydans]GEL24247.1 TetR family transcriptional regulator [Pseudonocardia sulfidoxydans NBRC 16205]